MVNKRLASGMVLALASLAACGTGSNAGSNGAGGGATGGSNASGANAGMSPGAGGDGAGGTGTSGTPSKRAACIAYATAACERRVECGVPEMIDSSGCSDFDLFCPDAVFGPGSTRTVEGTLACAEAYRTFPCEDVLRGAVPDCVTPGTLDGGEVCRFDSQCKSLTCSGGSQCGTCLYLPDADHTCSDYDTSCLLGQRCVNVTECQDADPETPIFLPTLGETCSTLLGCADSACDAPDGSTAGTCVALPASGPCVNGHCAEGSYCDATSQCVTAPAAGQPCATVNGNSYCAPDSHCSSGTCEQYPGLGGSCFAAAGHLYTLGCQSGLACACADDSCSTGKCAKVVEEGQSCTDANVACPIGTECRSGICVALDSLGLLDACTAP